MRNVPVAAGRNPEIVLSKVVLPAPFGPISDTVRPASTSIETWFTATRGPKRTVTLSAASTGAAFNASTPDGIRPARAFGPTTASPPTAPRRERYRGRAAAVRRRAGPDRPARART